MIRNWLSSILRWVKSLKQPMDNNPRPVIARVILKQKDNDKYWLTAGPDWLDQVPLLPGEHLILPTNAFGVGTTLEIRGNLTKEAIDAGKEVQKL